MGPIEAVELEQWSERYEAGFELPRLIRQLLWASSSGVQRLDMPGGEHARLAGFDGVVICDDGDDCVPAGASVWELGTNADIETKATGDYTKRVEAPSGFALNQTTFVFTTSRKWPRGDTWAEEKSADGRWRIVRALWSRDLEKWLERHPLISAAFACDVLKSSHEGVRSFYSLWDEYASIIGREAEELSPQFVIGGRESHVHAIQRWIASESTGGISALSLVGPSRREAMDFLVASIRSLPEEERERYEAMFYLVTTPAQARALRNVGPRNIIVTHPDAVLPHVNKACVRGGCKLVVVQGVDEAAGSVLPDSPPRCVLEPAGADEQIKVMVSLKIEHSQAKGIFEKCNGRYEEIRKHCFFY